MVSDGPEIKQSFDFRKSEGSVFAISTDFEVSGNGVVECHVPVVCFNSIDELCQVFGAPLHGTEVEVGALSVADARSERSELFCQSVRDY